jgi:hypothetical protein
MTGVRRGNVAAPKCDHTLKCDDTLKCDGTLEREAPKCEAPKP